MCIYIYIYIHTYIGGGSPAAAGLRATVVQHPGAATRRQLCIGTISVLFSNLENI